jgi:hypothetical protein
MCGMTHHSRWAGLPNEVIAGQVKALDDVTVCLETLISVLETSIKKSLGYKNFHHILEYIYWVIKAK